MEQVRAPRFHDIRWPGLAVLALLVVLVLAALAASFAGWWHPVFRPGLALQETLAVRIHLAAALSALVLGVAIFLNRKGRVAHRTMGWTWAALMIVVAASTLFITEINPGRYSFIHLFVGVVAVTLPLGLYAIKARHDVGRHRRSMTSLFLGALILTGAFAILPGRLLWRVFVGP